MKKTGVLYWGILFGMILFLSLPVFSKVTVKVTNEGYVLPVAELASTKTNPDIINIENDFITIQLIPNRGRVLTSYQLKNSNQNFFFQNLVPDPMTLPGGLHTVEFGGYYLSLPWNTRDRQPFDLNYEIKQSTGDKAEIYLSGRDMFQKTFTEIWLRVYDSDAPVEVEVSITNSSKVNAKNIDWKDYSVFAINDSSPNGDQIIVPVEKIKLLDSKDHWAGQNGAIMDWSSSWSQWTSLTKYISVATEGQLKYPYVGIFYPEAKTLFFKFWNPKEFFEGIEFWTWGEEFQNEPGARPYVVTSCLKKITLQPQEKMSFKTYFGALTGGSEKGIDFAEINQKIELLRK